MTKIQNRCKISGKERQVRKRWTRKSTSPVQRLVVSTFFFTLSHSVSWIGERIARCLRWAVSTPWVRFQHVSTSAWLLSVAPVYCFTSGLFSDLMQEDFLSFFSVHPFLHRSVRPDVFPWQCSTSGLFSGNIRSNQEVLRIFSQFVFFLFTRTFVCPDVFLSATSFWSYLSGHVPQVQSEGAHPGSLRTLSVCPDVFPYIFVSVKWWWCWLWWIGALFLETELGRLSSADTETNGPIHTHVLGNHFLSFCLDNLAKVNCSARWIIRDSLQHAGI